MLYMSSTDRRWTKRCGCRSTDFRGCARVGALGATRHPAPKQLAARCAEAPEALVGLVGAVVPDSLSRRFTTCLEPPSGIVTVRGLSDARAWRLVNAACVGQLSSFSSLFDAALAPPRSARAHVQLPQPTATLPRPVRAACCTTPPSWFVALREHALDDVRLDHWTGAKSNQPAAQINLKLPRRGAPFCPAQRHTPSCSRCR